MPYRLKQSEHYFCSRQCSAEWRAKNKVFAGSKNPAWSGGYDDYYGPNWSQQRKLALERDKYTCQICTSIRHNNKDKELSVHHIIPFDDYNYIPDENDNYLQANVLDNLLTLCMRCHRLVENGITIEEAKEMNLKPLKKSKEQVIDEYECLLCHRTFTNERDVYYHSKRVHNVRKDEYIIRFFGQPLCKCGCGQPIKYNKSQKRFPDYINGHNARGHERSTETKKKMSEKRKAWWIKHQMGICSK
jgi:5-methylcytosine-specific restriction endonuclease McrA